MRIHKPRRQKLKDDALILRQALRVMRRRARHADIQFTIGYHLAKYAVPTVCPIQTAERTIDRDHVYRWSKAIDAQDDAKRDQFKANRLESIKAKQQSETQLVALMRAVKRCPVELRVLPETPMGPHPVGYVGAPLADMGSELLDLLATIKDDSRRADIAAQCWIVRADNPQFRPDQVFSRACSIVRDVSIGRFGGETHRTARRREETDPYNAAEVESAFGWLSALKNQPTVWTDFVLSCAERQLSPDLRNAIASNDAGLTQAEIAKQLDISPSTISKRLGELRQSLARYAAAIAK